MQQWIIFKGNLPFSDRAAAQNSAPKGQFSAILEGFSPKSSKTACPQCQWDETSLPW
jgi:hypothetical protein